MASAAAITEWWSRVAGGCGKNCRIPAPSHARTGLFYSAFLPAVSALLFPPLPGCVQMYLIDRAPSTSHVQPISTVHRARRKRRASPHGLAALAAHRRNAGVGLSVGLGQ